MLEGTLRPSSDTPTHAVLYRRFEALGGIVHSHSRFASAWAQAGRELPCFGTTHADHFRGPVPVTRPLAADEIQGDYEQRTGDVIVETFEGRGLDPLETPAALVVHGPFARGVDVGAGGRERGRPRDGGRARSVHARLEGRGVGTRRRPLDRHFSRKHGPDAYYGQPR